MLDLLIDALVDTLKTLPFLFLAFLLLEYIEHKMSNKNKKLLVQNHKLGPFVGSLLGAVPQCGFSALTTNLFSSRVITIGTLIAVYLSTSDEMLPILISRGTNILIILKIIGIKIIIGIIIGYLIDLIIKSKSKSDIHEMCSHEDCHCDEDGILKSSIIHTLKIGLFLLIATVFINLIIYFIGEEHIANFIENKTILAYFISSLIGLIPNCASSVMITELYLSNLISFGIMLSGLLTGAGVGLLILFRTNKNIKENLTILAIIYFVGVIIGYLLDIVGIV